MRSCRLFFIFIWAASLLFATVHRAFPEEGEAASRKTVDKKVDDLDQKLRDLERRFELRQRGAAEKGIEPPRSAPDREGFSLKSPDDQFLLRFRGVIQADERFLRPGTDIRFVERALPTNLVPNRDIGVELFGNVDDFPGTMKVIS